MAKVKYPRGKYPRPSLQERFYNKVKKTQSCWLWVGTKNGRGYGVIGDGGKLLLAHRVSYRLFNGDLLIGLCVLHKCDNTSCVNPDHLWLGSQRENMRDKCLKGRACGSKGVRNGRAKLNENLVKEIRRLYKTQEFSHTGLAEVFNVSKATIYYITNNINWT